MEIKKIKIAGCEVNMIFTGGQYIFYNDWDGVIGVATRKGFYAYSEDRHTFDIKAGTENTVGGSINRSSIITAMKRLITKSENKYKKHDTIFEDSGELCNCRIEFQLIEQTK